MSNSLSDDQRQQVVNALLAGNKIEAIKLYRKATGLDLKDSKDFVDQLEEALRKENPEAFQRTSKAGCGTTVLLIFCSIIWMIWTVCS